ncbi:hypothetical protein BUALT_Bualt10G0021400 [Buddleja alternifolia]|uniref:phosphatidylglycerophosphatase n=1 Tax=Buddleja alternifolia TaxID=168488 RepID=A0AAV6WWH8_9LAMI|nr:hypothetical protein BUALT_Bualt10G0021400 [Buddleja alternifolia]
MEEGPPQYQVETRNGRKARLGTQVETRNRKKARLGTQVETRNRRKAHLGTQVKTRNRRKARLGTQVETRNRKKAHLGTQVETWNRRKARLGTHVKTRNKSKDPLGTQVETRNVNARLGTQVETRMVRLGTQVLKSGLRMVRLNAQVLKSGLRMVRLSAQVLKSGLRMVRLGTQVKLSLSVWSESVYRLINSKRFSNGSKKRVSIFLGEAIMYIEELKESEDGERQLPGGSDVLCKADGAIVVWWDAKRVFVGVGARALFYPTLLYNVVRNKIQSEFRWWDWIDEFVLLGAVPFPSDIHRLKELGVCGVVTLNESYETLVPSSLYEAHGIHHLVLPTRDYLFAPSLADICQAVDFIHENALHRRSTYVHCKAGRGRSTTIVLCYLVKYREMMPDAAYDYVKSIRPRVLLASTQWKAVQEFYHLKVKCTQLTNLLFRSPKLLSARDLLSFDDGSVVVITKADLDGYDPGNGSNVDRNEIWEDVNLIYQVKIVSEAALSRLSCLWLRYYRQQKSLSEKLTSDGGCADSGPNTVDIHLFP